MQKKRFVYWVHTNKTEPSRIFKTKRAAIEWGRVFYRGLFIVEPIVTTKLSERVEYIRTALGYDLLAA